jgi:hypothetical protein
LRCTPRARGACRGVCCALSPCAFLPKALSDRNLVSYPARPWPPSLTRHLQVLPRLPLFLFPPVGFWFGWLHFGSSGSSCLCLPSARILDVCHHTQRVTLSTLMCDEKLQLGLDMAFLRNDTGFVTVFLEGLLLRSESWGSWCWLCSRIQDSLLPSPWQTQAPCAN